MHPPLSSAPNSRLGETEWYSALLDRLPPWPLSLVSRASTHGLHPTSDGTIVHSGETHVLVSRCIAGARWLSDDALEEEVAAAYTSVLGEVARHGRHVVRCWNFIPGIQDRAGHGLNRYMVFNAGRHRGYRRASGTSDLAVQAIATASGVGTDGHDLFVAALGSVSAGVPIENPRQVPAYRYSSRFGPLPPCFSRATLEADAKRLLVGGTSSVRGEDSMHPEAVGAQLDETLVNLDALITEGARLASAAPARPAIAGFTHVRVYVVDEGDRSAACDRLVDAGVTCPIETVVARLCRPELLVEVEGVVSL